MNFPEGPLIQNTSLGFPRLCGNLINMQYLIWKSTIDILYRKDTANGFFLLWSKRQQINLRRVIIKKQIPLFIFFYQNLLRQVLVFLAQRSPLQWCFLQVTLGGTTPPGCYLGWQPGLEGWGQVQVMKAGAAELGGLWQLHSEHSSGETRETPLMSSWAGATWGLWQQNSNTPPLSCLGQSTAPSNACWHCLVLRISEAGFVYSQNTEVCKLAWNN